MRDDRTFIRLHDGMPDHPKVEALSDRAFRLLVERWCWCSRHRTDGRISLAVWGKSGTPAARRELVAAGLVEELGDHVMMHDYLEHQRSAEDIAESTEAKRQRSLAANHGRWHTQQGKIDPSCLYCIQQGSRQGSESGSKHGSLASPKSSSDTDTDTDIKEPEPEARKLCERLAELIVANDPKAKPIVGQRWLDAARLLLARDGRPFDEVMAVVEWTQADQFEMGNVLSMPKLRSRYGQLRMKALNAGALGRSQTLQTVDGARDWLKGEWRAGRVRNIEERTGLRYPQPDLPLELQEDQVEQWLIGQCRSWIAANHDVIIERLTVRSTV